MDNFQDHRGDDPRIDSPEIKVIYPAMTKEIPVVQPKNLTANESETNETSDPVEPPKEEQHECKVGFQQAVQQNVLPFLGVIVLALLVGFFFGKK